MVHCEPAGQRAKLFTTSSPVFVLGTPLKFEEVMIRSLYTAEETLSVCCSKTASQRTQLTDHSERTKHGLARLNALLAKSAEGFLGVVHGETASHSAKLFETSSSVFVLSTPLEHERVMIRCCGKAASQRAQLTLADHSERTLGTSLEIVEAALGRDLQ